MQSGGANRLPVILTLMALPFLVGSSCFFAFGSGDGSGGAIVKKDDDNDDDKDETGFVQTGTFSSPAAAGVNYETGSLAGVTGSKGEFKYVEGETVRFSIGDITLGAPVKGKPAISPPDLAADSDGGAAAAVNITRLLQSLDADPADEVITIPANVRSAAVRSNASIATAIEFLDFSDEAAFVNTASQLVSVLTEDYPFTAMLIDADNVGAGKHRSPDNDPDP